MRRAHELSRRLDIEEKSGQGGPSITHWYHLWGTLVLKFEPGLLQEFEGEALSRAGSLNELGRKLEWDPRSIAAVRDGRDTITIDKLKRLLDFLDKPYDSVEKNIIGIGSKRGIVIRNPKLPFNLNTTAGARVIAASLKDGGINVAHHYFQYTNYDRAKRDKVTEAVRAVFGDVSSSIMRDKEGKQKGISFDTAAIGEALIRAGIPVGEKVYQEYHVPDFILEGTREQKIEYMSQTIGDEGHRDKEHYDIKFGQAINVEGLLSEEDKKVLENLEWEIKTLPSGYKEEFVVLTRNVTEGFTSELRSIIYEQSRPPNIDEERAMLKDLFEVKADIYPEQIYRTKLKGYRVYWASRITGKDIYDRVVSELGLTDEDEE